MEEMKRVPHYFEPIEIDGVLINSYEQLKAYLPFDTYYDSDSQLLETSLKLYQGVTYYIEQSCTLFAINPIALRSYCDYHQGSYEDDSYSGDCNCSTCIEGINVVTGEKVEILYTGNPISYDINDVFPPSVPSQLVNELRLMILGLSSSISIRDIGIEPNLPLGKPIYGLEREISLGTYCKSLIDIYYYYLSSKYPSLLEAYSKRNKSVQLDIKSLEDYLFLSSIFIMIGLEGKIYPPDTPLIRDLRLPYLSPGPYYQLIDNKVEEVIIEEISTSTCWIGYEDYKVPDENIVELNTIITYRYKDKKWRDGTQAGGTFWDSSYGSPPLTLSNLYLINKGNRTTEDVLSSYRYEGGSPAPYEYPFKRLINI